MVLPSGFALPPFLYLVALLGGTVLVSALLWAHKPQIDQRTVVALAPWMAIGGTLHALNQPPIEVYDAILQPLFGTPAVYLTTYITLGIVWIPISMFGFNRRAGYSEARMLGLSGTGVLTVLVVLSIIMAIRSDLIGIFWPTIAILGSGLVAAGAILVVALWRTPIIVRARYAAPVVVYAHVLDGVSTAIGTDVIGIGERSPIPRAIIEFTGSLPTAPYLGSGWLFVLIKLVVASAVIIWMTPYLDEEPVEGSLLLSFIAAVGLGPAANNVVLFLFIPT